MPTESGSGGGGALPSVVLEAELDALRAQVAHLRSENVRLLRLLDLTPAQARPPGPVQTGIFDAAPGSVHAGSSPATKVSFFAALFGARTDVYAVRWENRRSGKAGWMPAVRGGWRRGVPADQREYLPLTEEVLTAHLSGELDLGLYPLLDGDRCWWLAADFDGTAAMLDFIAQDETYRRLLQSMGMDMSAPVIGFLSYIAQFMALPLACFLGWRLGAVRQEEADGRLDNLLVRGMIRWRWLTIITAQAFAAAALLAAASGVSLWAGGQLVNSGVTAAQVAEPMAATLPLLALSTGIATLSFGLAPRLTIALPVTITVLSYLLETFGTMLGWPSSVVGISPFHHLARLPSTPMTTTSILVLTGTGLTTAAIGITAFARRDLRGA